MSEIEQLRLENERLNHLVEQAHNVVSELIDGSRMQNVERCGAWEVKESLGKAVSAYYAKRANTASTRTAGGLLIPESEPTHQF